MPKISVNYVIEVDEEDKLDILDQIELYGQDEIGVELMALMTAGECRAEWCEIRVVEG